MQYSDLIEKKRHGTPCFPVEYYYIDKAHPRYIMQIHWHKEFEIVRVVSGKLTVYLHHTPYEMQAGDCLFIEGGCLKRGYPDHCVYECLVFDAAMLDGRIGNGAEHCFFKLWGEGVHYRNFIDPEDLQIISVIDKLLRVTAEAKPFYELQTAGLLYELFYHLYTSAYITQNRNSAADKGMHTVVALLEWIEQHNSDRITLADLSRVTGFSEKYICRIFKEYTAKTVMNYVNESRVEKACAKMLTNSITQTAFECGFNDLSHFCKTFKKYKGISPSQYKKSILNQR